MAKKAQRQNKVVPTIVHGHVCTVPCALCEASDVLHYRINFRTLTTPQIIFTALHVMQTRYSEENSLRLSVRPSVTRVIPDKTEERSVQIFIPYKRIFILVFWEEEWLVGATPSTWNFGSTDPRWSEIADFQPIIARSTSAVTRTEKKFN